MSKKIKVTLPDDLAHIMKRVAAFQGYTLAAFLRHAGVRVIRQYRHNFGFLDENDERVLDGLSNAGKTQ